MSRDRVVQQPGSESASPPPTAARERVVQALCVHFAADHLGMEELESRLTRVYGARSSQELAGLLADLPALPADAADSGARRLPGDAGQ
jgi:hypothetical protein